MQNTIILGDCLQVMKDIPDGSIDLIVTDPPYGNMKGADLDGWANQTTSWDNALDPKDIYGQSDRILRENGALVLFSQEPYTSRLITQAHNNLPFSYRMIWLKDHFANALVAKKAPVSYFEDILVFFKKYDTLNINPLRNYAEKVMRYIGKGLKEINKELGHRKAEHFFYTKTTQFGICTEETYNELIAVFGIDKMEGYKNYEEIKEIDRNSRQVRVFNLPSNARFKSNVLKHKKDYSKMHPTQKPVKLIEDLILTYSNPSDTVLDFTIGSGTTAIAALNTGRFFIGIEKDETYHAIATQRVKDWHEQREQRLFNV